jgi:hypothetical protein
VSPAALAAATTESAAAATAAAAESAFAIESAILIESALAASQAALSHLDPQQDARHRAAPATKNRTTFFISLVYNMN